LTWDYPAPWFCRSSRDAWSPPGPPSMRPTVSTMRSAVWDHRSRASTRHIDPAGLSVTPHVPEPTLAVADCHVWLCQAIN
jgi:hypothetical protein